MQEIKNYFLAIIKRNEDVASNHMLVWIDGTLKQKINGNKKGDNCFFIETIDDNYKGWVSLDDVKMLSFQEA
jgi:hypothetical protein